MSTITASFQPANLRIMEIRYDCDLTREGGDAIPLGVLADLSVGGAEGIAYGLGLVARKTLSAVEAQMIGQLLRADLSTPFTYLRGIFDDVFKAEEPIKAFADLPMRHMHSLRFEFKEESQKLKLPRALVTANADARRLWLKDQLSSHGNRAYWQLFPEHVPDHVDKDVEDQARDIAA